MSLLKCVKVFALFPTYLASVVHEMYKINTAFSVLLFFFFFSSMYNVNSSVTVSL